jgi:DNA-binding MarR family transcriptional regulator
LAADLDIAAPTLTRQLQKMEDAGLLTRTIAASDRRRVMVTLTSSGASSLSHHSVFRGSPLADAAEQLTPTQRRELVEAVSRLVRLARKMDLAASP